MGCVKGAVTSNLPEVKELVGGVPAVCWGESLWPGQARGEGKGLPGTEWGEVAPELFTALHLPSTLRLA